MKLIPVRPENVSLAWKDVEQYVKNSLDFCDGKYSVEDVLELLASQLLILWVVYNEDKGRAVGCLLTEVTQYPKLRALYIFLLGADDFSETVVTLDELKDFAKDAGCEHIELAGRPGWEKTLKPWGFDKIHTVMRLKL